MWPLHWILWTWNKTYMILGLDKFTGRMQSKTNLKVRENRNQILGIQRSARTEKWSHNPAGDFGWHSINSLSTRSPRVAKRCDFVSSEAWLRRGWGDLEVGWEYFLSERRKTKTFLTIISVSQCLETRIEKQILSLAVVASRTTGEANHQIWCKLRQEMYYITWRT